MIVSMAKLAKQPRNLDAVLPSGQVLYTLNSFHSLLWAEVWNLFLTGTAPLRGVSPYLYAPFPNSTASEVLFCPRPAYWLSTALLIVPGALIYSCWDWRTQVPAGVAFMLVCIAMIIKVYSEKVQSASPCQCLPREAILKPRLLQYSQ